ncbi:hypothetical protein H9Q13_12450 [Pontibacter sp. JH31]|uniref:Uncharacterized protein n=1 Tax=Pontibacter aquaedesilientis TaxID=2766980 RepID=A0ABR7XI54_9BACT|nr:hypothetical protein [Pontibacter aquaedesilientis]MBD1397979.1 hypothetical protein [Pontibacter aquaedesilientis]
MKSTLCIAILCLLLSLLAVSCTEEEAVPSCVQVEVIGPDCAGGWVVLKVLGDETAPGQRSKEYVGQLQSGFVTTDNLPLELRKAGLLLHLSLERNGDYGPFCAAIYMMYPPVRVKQVCPANTVGH